MGLCRSRVIMNIGIEQTLSEPTHLVYSLEKSIVTSNRFNHDRKIQLATHYFKKFRFNTNYLDVTPRLTENKNFSKLEIYQK